MLAATDPSYASTPNDVILLSHRGLDPVLQKHKLTAEARALDSAVSLELFRHLFTPCALRLHLLCNFKLMKFVYRQAEMENTRSKCRRSWMLGILFDVSVRPASGTLTPAQGLEFRESREYDVECMSNAPALLASVVQRQLDSVCCCEFAVIVPAWSNETLGFTLQTRSNAGF